MSSIVTDDSFEQAVTNASGPVLVDFWADWCGPCRAISPALEEISAELDGRIRVLKLNVDDNPEMTARFNVRSIPTLMIFKDGQPAATKVGSAPKSAIKAWVEQSL